MNADALVLLLGGIMRRIILFILLAMLIAALPLWPFNSGWTYGPAITAAFLLTVNLMVPLVEILARWRAFRDGQSMARWRDGQNSPQNPV
jgi:hypothetical protein